VPQIPQRLPVTPPSALSGDVRPPLFVRVDGFF
jgi:hypothetical protein